MVGRRKRNADKRGLGGGKKEKEKLGSVRVQYTEEVEGG
jgi:hypothetical protein